MYAVLERSNSQVSYNYFNKEAAAIFKESDPNICGLSMGDTVVSLVSTEISKKLYIYFPFCLNNLKTYR